MKKGILAVGVAAALAALAPQAQARGIFAIGLNFGIPICPRPVYAPVYYPYYPPYPVYVAPSPVYVAPPPVYVAPPTPVVQAAPSVSQPVPVVRAQATSSNGNDYQHPVGSPQVQGSYSVPPGAVPVVNRCLQQLSDQQERVRSDAALELGRLKAEQAIDPLCTLLSTDRSPEVRETAARALGLIGSVRGLSALQNAAQMDVDRDVRRSAQFSAEVIRTNLRNY